MNAVELVQISRRFGGVVANDGIDLEVASGEIHCLLGENGAGKTTLMKILFGLYKMDSGRILIRGRQCVISNPKTAIRLGIGMVHQHFMLVPRLTTTENIIAGQEPVRGPFLNMAQARKKVKELSEKYGLRVDPEARIEDTSVGEQQRVEILKALYRDVDILILDEPTAILTPNEVCDLFAVLRKLKEDGKTILFITHKLRETMAIAERITVLRNGRNAGTVNTADTSVNALARLMVGRSVILRVEKQAKMPGDVLFEVQQLYVSNPKTHIRLKNIAMAIRSGEIIGVAGVAGNGQLELEEALMGLRAIERGRLLLDSQDITGLATAGRRKAGLAHIPSDRLLRGTIPAFSIEENVVLGSQWHRPFSTRGILLQNGISSYTQKLMKAFNIKGHSGKMVLSSLSGGNQQKVVLARELSRAPKVVIAAQPTRGVDVGVIEHVHNMLLGMRAQGKAILLISAELDELISLSDRILVLYEGEIVAQGKTEMFSLETLGLLMAGQRQGDQQEGSGL